MERTPSFSRLLPLVGIVLALVPLSAAAPAEPPVPAGPAPGVTVVGSAAFTYLPGEVTINAGDHVIYSNTDPAGLGGHSFTHAVDDPLFYTPVMITGGTADVSGVDELLAGSYPVACEIHPQMTGTLTVR